MVHWLDMNRWFGFIPLTTQRAAAWHGGACASARPLLRDVHMQAFCSRCCHDSPPLEMAVCAVVPVGVDAAGSQLVL